MARDSSRARDLREACVVEALAIIERSGIEALSLREVARRLGVSHQAPYKHYPSRDHLLAEVVARAFAAFAVHLERRPRSPDPHEDLAAMGRAYLAYALANPLSYRLMFGTPLPEPTRHPEMMHRAQHAFAMLREGIARLRFAAPHRPVGPPPELDALFVWATVHGLASVLQTSALGTLALPDGTLDALVPHALGRLSLALDGDPDRRAAPHVQPADRSCALPDEGEP